tara:strand:- start:32022 stop:32651 length:630 start_codon:yes stop_codon:yes gene_type:complete
MNTENLEKKKTIKDFLKSNLKIFSIIFFILILLGIFFLWLDYTNKTKKINISQDFIDAKVLLSENNKKESLEILTNIINKKDKTYSPLSLYLMIDKKLVDNPNLINEYFDVVISIGGLEKEDLNLLKLKKAIHTSQNSDENELLDLLNPIINSKSVWRAQSIEFIGDYYFSKKQYKKAEQYYSQLLNDVENSGYDVGDLKRKMKIIKND